MPPSFFEVLHLKDVRLKCLFEWFNIIHLR
jgi:hypothetical protein